MILLMTMAMAMMTNNDKAMTRTATTITTMIRFTMATQMTQELFKMK